MSDRLSRENFQKEVEKDAELLRKFMNTQEKQKKSSVGCTNKFFAVVSSLIVVVTVLGIIYNQ